MGAQDTKPLYWEPEPDLGYAVERRPDGGMNITVWRIDEHTLEHWRRFAETHELYSDRLTRNLYDLRSLEDFPEEAIQYAVEINSDPAARRLRVAVLVSNDKVRKAIERVIALTAPEGGAEIRIFTDPTEAEAWLARPLEDML